MLEKKVLKLIIKYTDLTLKSVKEKPFEKLDNDLTTIFLMFYSDVTKKK